MVVTLGVCEEWVGMVVTLGVCEGGNVWGWGDGVGEV